MRLDRPTHVMQTNRGSGWMSNFTEEIPGQLASIIGKIGDGRYEFLSIFPLPADVAQDDVVYSDEFMQTVGNRSGLTVEIKRQDPDGRHRLYTVGRPEAAGESETAVITNVDVSYAVRPSEVLTPAEAIELFQFYYDNHSVPSGWHVREQVEFTAELPPRESPTKPGSRRSR